MGDFNIDINSSGVEKNKLEEFCNLFGLAKLIHGNTCCTKNHASTTKTTLVIIVRVFQVFFISYYIRLKPKVVNYRNYKNNNQSTFLKETESADFSADSNDPNKRYSHLTETFLKVVNKYAPSKSICK